MRRWNVTAVEVNDGLRIICGAMRTEVHREVVLGAQWVADLRCVSQIVDPVDGDRESARVLDGGPGIARAAHAVVRAAHDARADRRAAPRDHARAARGRRRRRGRGRGGRTAQRARVA